jgi:TolB-like protein
MLIAASRRLIVAAVMALPIAGGAAVSGQEKAEEKVAIVYPAAIFPFQERGKETKDMGAQVTDLLFASLAANPDIFLVDREDLKTLIAEQELNLSGLANPAEATRVGQLTGAKLLITGSVLQVGNSTHLIAKVIGTETSRVVGATAKGSDKEDLDALVSKLADEVVAAVKKRSQELVAKPVSREDRIAVLQKAIGKGPHPTVKIHIPERHVGQVTIDPAAETEMTVFCTESGFTVLDPKQADAKNADILIEGEGFSEFATRHGNLISVKARLEVKAIDRRTGRVLAADRQVSVELDLTEQIAGKSALQEAAAEIAARMLPKIATPVKEGEKKE